MATVSGVMLKRAFKCFTGAIREVTVEQRYSHLPVLGTIFYIVNHLLLFYYKCVLHFVNVTNFIVILLSFLLRCAEYVEKTPSNEVSQRHNFG